MASKLEARKRRSKLISSGAISRLYQVSQVVTPVSSYDNLPNRMTTRGVHVHMVKEQADVMVESIAEDSVDLDYKYEIGAVCLAHDAGQPPGQHPGSKVLDEVFTKLGVPEGFDDNNNNFNVLLKNCGPRIFSDYGWASLVKYPTKLYPYMAEKISLQLDRAIIQDMEFLYENGFTPTDRTRTIACEIMDEADRDCYVATDLSDFFTLGYNDEKPIQEILESGKFVSSGSLSMLTNMAAAIKSKNKSLVRSAFADLRMELASNYYLDNGGSLKHKDIELYNLRESLFEVEKQIFIHSDRVQAIVKKQENMIRQYINYVVEEEFYPSSTYKHLIEKCDNNLTKMRLIRDMIAEQTDVYVEHIYQKFIS